MCWRGYRTILGDLYETKGEYSLALGYYRKAIKTKNDFATPYIGVGDIFYELGDYYSAYVMYGKALRFKPEDEELIKSRKKAEEGFRKKMVIYFDLDSFSIPDEYIFRLQVLSDVLAAGNKGRIEITGHTCDIGSRGYNRRLSERRAKAVKDYLKGYFTIDEDKIITRGKGEETPFLRGGDKDSRILNRRVEIVLKEEE